ncbi:hypothetical protein ACIQ9R_37470 [Streptomyces sp. NPDC094447]|uniref:hypothetical protein n=1 Tax=Streptomyces sp. NPDC094447 TaxID=3366062 RepID=UPI00380692A7
MTDQPTPCRTTQHCAAHGFCHRCTPSLDGAVRHLVKAISAAGITTGSGHVYEQLAATIRDAARTAAARQTTGQDDTACSLPGFVGCECNHLTGCEHPAPAVGQPAQAHDTEARTRQLILNCLTGRAVCPVPRPVDEATGLLDAYRAAILTAAADRFAAFDLHTEAAALRRMAVEDER